MNNANPQNCLIYIVDDDEGVRDSLSWLLGGMTGLELQDRLIERKSPLPIVFITGHGDVPLAVSTMKKGALDFIQKPFEEKAIVTLIARLIEQAKENFVGKRNAASRSALLSRLTLIGASLRGWARSWSATTQPAKSMCAIK